MELSCLQENLKAGLSVARVAAKGLRTLPIASSVLLSAENGCLTIEATDLITAVKVRVGAKVEGEGSCAVPFKQLNQTVKSFPAERIDIGLDGSTLVLICAGSKISIQAGDAADFPLIPTVESGVVGKIESQVLKDAIAHVAFAAATEDSRPVLTGIKVEITGADFTFAAADGFRLGVYKGKLAEPLSEDVSFIIPARALQEVNRLMGKCESVVDFTVSPDRVLFRLGETDLVSQLIQGTFPNYSQLIPQSYDARVVVDQELLLQAVSSAWSPGSDSGIVRLFGSAEGLLVSSSDETNTSETRVNIVSGSDFKIAFFGKYLIDVLKVLGKGEVALETTTPSSPGVLRPVSLPPDVDYIHVVMPMFVQW